MQTITIDNIIYNLVPVETSVEKVEYKKPRYETYYAIDTDDVATITDIMDITDNFLYTTHNYFETYSETQQYRDYLLALGRINHRIYEMNEGWRANWKRDNYHCAPIYNYGEGKWNTSESNFQQLMSIFTPVKSREILKTLFVEMKDDFETVRVWAMR